MKLFLIVFLFVHSLTLPGPIASGAPLSATHNATGGNLGFVSVFTVPAAFPTSVFQEYYVTPGPTTDGQPQPVISDPVSNVTYPFNLTDPNTRPTHGLDPVEFPSALANMTADEVSALLHEAITSIWDIAEASNSTNCSKCVASLLIGQTVAQFAPTWLPAVMTSLCKETGFQTADVCEEMYQPATYGAPWAQVLRYANVSGLDGHYICAFLSPNFCPQPGVAPYTVKFPKPRPNRTKVPVRSGERVKILHLSDLHLDTRYKTGSEANCTTGMCCRISSTQFSKNMAPPEISQPAPLFGSYKCDSPYYLALAALQSVEPLTGVSVQEPPAFTLYTGDLVAHEPEVTNGREYVQAAEVAVWEIFKAYIGGPIYAALGNHDSVPTNLESPHSIDNSGPLGQQFSWHYDHISRLWEHYGWIDNNAQSQASLHYGGYSVVHPLGLRIITINTDFYYRTNVFAFLHADDPDHSGIFSFLVKGLQEAEDQGQRAWIVGHVPTGWQGLNALPGGSDAFYQIIERYSPQVIANVFFGHTHEDQVSIYYRNNGSSQTASDALTTAWIGPSLTPLTNLNSGYRLYEVDTGTWEIFEAYTFYSDVSSFPALNDTGPVFEFEYSTRQAYGSAANWPDGEPLNATFWHRVTEAMEKDRQLASLFNTYQGKSSVRSPNCTSDACVAAKICYIKSGSTALGRACPQGFASVQSPYTGVNS
ncbi:Metallo-dependent phosphatase-like protein [Triangularia verruculosa]|uniref:Metallo-dependent phosphatase-like protein n=1 Tax=Triangularia verruculosa TaxID=2587418 RepID=A0AAN6XNV3_9PEZI|nr:Metallo-dependent phosphatase-like protein [Triangularia verruculosa]